ncbi:MAG: nitrogen fixation protein NifQ [Tepidimonas sp.]|uniref:nitrogen fixation protein NifQ n=1 Tax=Tepidimonas sp. TaxID=2002775 RepID=UPI00259EA773|nr:nitrogen fixation protein NifQ [Tepidimonas sp.]MDM7457098.1 nitrogen fixation protein NifQ [Tepidimonas sp.]
MHRRDFLISLEGLALAAPETGLHIFGTRHLWQELGLAGRPEVSRLLRLCFPDLAARNTPDLKWKRFLFQALGEQLGLPSLGFPAAPTATPMPTASAPCFSCPAPQPGISSPPYP